MVSSLKKIHQLYRYPLESALSINSVEEIHLLMKFTNSINMININSGDGAHKIWKL